MPRTSRARSALAVIAVALAAALVLPAAAPAAADTSSPNMSLIANFPYEARNGEIPNYGTDIEFAEIGDRRYAFAGSYRNGMQIFDVTDPRSTQRVGVYDCGVTQGDVQVFRRDDMPGRVFATYTSDTYGDGTSTCYREAAALGFDVRKDDGRGRNGTFIVEVTQPDAPRTVSFIAIPQGSHNQTVHPSGLWMYNSNSDLITSVQPAIEVIDLRDLSKPAIEAELALPTRPGLGTESHDITFNESGTRAYSAALSQGVIIDSTDPGKPKVITSFLDPAINVWHQSDPFTLTDASGAKRDFLIVEDEFAGAVGTGQCPNGGVHVYEITGELEREPVKVGYWNISDTGPTATPEDSCTAHVFDIHEDAKVMTIAYYNGGVRVVDLSGLAGISLGGSSITGEGMREIGFYRTADADTWSAKSPRIGKSRSGAFYLFGNDIRRGLDVYRFDWGAGRSADRGRWMTPTEIAALRATQPRATAAPGRSLLCLLPS